MLRAAPLLLFVLLPLPAHALVPEPPHLIRGAVTVNGAPRTWGTVTVRLAASPEAAIATFRLGALPGAANGFLLAVPMDALEPRTPGSARPGDPALLYLDGAPAGEVTVGERGGEQTADLVLAAPHEIVLVRGPGGTPSSTASGGAVYLDVEAADSAGHLLAYAWAAACPGADEGVFDDPLARTPVWTAPLTGGSPLACSLTVSIADGQGLVVERSILVTVERSAAPEPAPEFSVTPDPSWCGEELVFDGRASSHDDPERSIVRYEWDFDYDGVTFDVETTGAAVTHGYGSRGGAVTAALRVTDDAVVPRSAIATRVVHPGGANRSPTADAGGPYALGPAGELALRGLGSADPDAACGDGIAAWDWDLDGDGAFDDATGPEPVIGWDAVERLLCGGRCVDGQGYRVALRVRDASGSSAVDEAEVVISFLLFADDFADGSAAGDPDWLVRSGAWTVLGEVAEKRFYASGPAVGGLSVLKPSGMGAMLAGRLETNVALSGSFVVSANGAVVFGYADNAHYRYVRLLRYSGRGGLGRLDLGQVGRIGADRSGVKAYRILSGLRLGQWYRIWVDVYEDGRVNVRFNAWTARPAIKYRFGAAVAGRTGYQAYRARAYFDNFAVWGRGMLP
jgi:hypothetical protein